MEWPTFTPTALIPTPRPCMISGHVGGADRHGLCGQRTHLASPFDRSLVLRADRLLGARVKFVKNCQKMIHRYIGHSPKKIVKTFSKRCLPRVPDAYSKAGQFNPSDLPIYQSSSPQLWELLRHIYFHIHDIMTSTSSNFIARGLTSSPWGGRGVTGFYI